MSLDIEAKGYDQAKNLFKGLTSDVSQRYGTYLEKIADQLIDEIRSNIQNNQTINTGTLLSSIRILENENGKNILVGTNVPYAIYIEYGRGPVHGKGKPLHWKDKKSGEDVFAWWTRPSNPRPFIEPAAMTILSKVPQIVASLENKYVKELFG